MPPVSGYPHWWYGGDRNAFAEPRLVNRLTGAPRRMEVVIGDATHWVIYEAHRWELFGQVHRFLEQCRWPMDSRNATSVPSEALR